MTTTSKLLALPTEILISIIVQLPTASCLTRLAQTCKSLHIFINSEGWRIFVRHHHPLFHARVTKLLPPGRTVEAWRRWAEELTVTCSNWDNFGFVASAMFVEGKWRSRREKKAEEHRLGLRRRAQEDACTPVVDLWEEWVGGEEVLAIGAGVNMLVRRKRRHGKTDEWWRYDRAVSAGGDKDRYVDERGGEGIAGAGEGEDGDDDEERATFFEIFVAKHRAGYLRAGVDNPQDYTAVHLLGPQGRENAQIAVVGRACGTLEIVKLSTRPGKPGHMSVLSRYETPPITYKSSWTPRIGKFTSILPYPSSSGNQYGLMSVGVVTGRKSTLALYKVRIPSTDDFQITPEQPVAEVEMSSDDGCIWSTNLLSPEYLAITKTDSHESPLCVYAIAPDGIRKTPMRSFHDPRELGVGTDAMATVRLESFAGEFPSGQVFLSAWSGSGLNMHDLRSPKNTVANWGHFVSRPIHSLHALHSGKFLLGHSEACTLRILDTRGKYSDLEGCVPIEAEWSKHPYPYSWVTNFQLPHRSRPEPMDPIYALAVSPWTEKSVYAATPGMVWELNFAGMVTRLPDSVPSDGANGWKKMWQRSMVWKHGANRADRGDNDGREKETVKPVTLPVKAYNGLLWGMHQQQPPRRVYQRYE